jgi:protein-S-isoprenylcysteine O-methyltransferase Ste14
MTATLSDQMLVWLSRWRVNLGTVLTVVAMAVAHPGHPEILRAMPVVLLGVAIRVWARGHLDRRTRLTQTGPYALVRHPLYVGSFLIGLGISAMLGRWFAPLVFTVTYLVMYLPKAIREDRYLHGRYGVEYERYVAQVGAVFPRLGTAPFVPRVPFRFEWQRVMGHREWKTWLGVTAVVVALWVMATLFGGPRRVDHAGRPSGRTDVVRA